MNKAVPIVFCSNDSYIPIMAAMIQSIMEHAGPEREYRIFVLHRNITPEKMEKVKDWIGGGRLNISIDFINVSDYIKGKKFESQFPDEAFFRLLIPWLFADYEKVVYFDCDMIAISDIGELFDVDLDGFLLASSRDTYGIGSWYTGKQTGKWNMPPDRFSSLGITKVDDCFITGMVIFNIPLFRKSFNLEQIMDFAASRIFPFADQDVLNILCQGKVKLLPMAWDFIDFAGSDDVAGYFPPSIKNEYFEAKKTPKIIHFLGLLKPWLNHVNIDYCWLFWKYAARTPFIDDVVNQMREKGLIGHSGYVEGPLHEIRERRLGKRFLLKCFIEWFKSNYLCGDKGRKK